MRKYILLITAIAGWILQSLIFSVYAQVSFGSPGIVSKATPQTSDFMRYGEIPISLFTGQINFEVPIYQLNDPDFQIPIKAVYTSEGFKPSKRSGFIGYNWHLNVGGVITREVYGAPDDAMGYGQRARGFWWAAKEAGYDRDLLFSFDPSIVDCGNSYLGTCDVRCINNSSSQYCDLQPDLFSFNFCGHKGRFIINNEGNVVSFTKGYEIDFSRFAKQPSDFGSQPEQSEIIIKTPDGHTYYFGGKLNALEYTVSINAQNSTHDDLDPTIVGWHLTKIVAPNGRSLRLIYDGGDYYIDLKSFYQCTKAGTEITEVNNTRSPIEGSISMKLIERFYASKPVYISSIHIEDVNVKIDFIKSKHEMDQFYTEHPTVKYNYKYSFMLDTIKVISNGEELYTNYFKYKIDNKWNMLEEIYLAGKGAYRFKYKTIGNINPGYLDRIDPWGFIGYDYTGRALLERIEYPTGGYSILKYEQHEYDFAVLINKENDYQKTLRSVKTIPSTKSNKPGSLRISKIEHYSLKDVLASSKEYYYKFWSPSATDTKPKKDGNNSSGILYQFPPYTETITGHKFIDSQIWINNYNIEEPYIGYSTVIELNNDGGITSYIFSDYFTNADDRDIHIKQIIPISEKETTKYDNYMFSLSALNVAKFNSSADLRGHLIGKKQYNSKGEMIRYEDFFYRNIAFVLYCPTFRERAEDHFKDDYVVSFRPIQNGALARKIKMRSTPLIYERCITDIVKNDTGIPSLIPIGLVCEYKYVYNEYDLLAKKVEYLNDTDSITSIYKYSGDDSSSLDKNIHNYLLDKNIINLPVDEKKFKNINCLSNKMNMYSINTGKHKFPILDSIRFNFANDPIKTEVLYMNYNKINNNPIYIIEKDINKTIYLWSYNHQYPIAEIKNASYEQVQDALGGENYVNALSSKFQPLETDFEKIANLRTSLPGSHITTYTYKPLVGMLTATDPRGVTTYYDYDEFGRLKETYIKENNVKKVIQAYNYNYANQ